MTVVTISFFSRQIREGAFLKLRIKIAYKNCIFDQIRHCALPLDLGPGGKRKSKRLHYCGVIRI